MPGQQQKITTCLWFNFNAEEAVQHYTSIFKNSKVLATTHYTEAGPGKKGSVLTVLFQLEGVELMALNGGPEFKFSEAISLVVNCESQEEIDRIWNKLAANPEEGQCGWLKDKFGVSWQITPTALQRMLLDEDPAKTNRVMQALLQMKKLDLGRLEKAYKGA